MFIKPTLALLFCGVLFAPCALAESSTDDITDPRQLVDIPPAAQQLMRQDMLSHLSALHSIIAALGNNDLKAAADTAEQQLGRASMGKHRASGMGPGRFMSPEMRDLGWGMHDAADAFATEARKGNPQSAFAALQKVTSSCVACHAVYRTR